MDVRYTCKTAVLEFLGLVRDRLLVSWSRRIPTDRAVMKMICDLWFIETQDPIFSSWSAKAITQRESAVFNSCFLIAHEMGTTIDWGNLLSLFQGEPELIATVSLCHLDHEISHEGNWDLNCIAWDLHIITMLSFRESICLALMRQGTIKAAAEILTFVVDHEWEGEARAPAARCMVNAVVLLKTRIEDMDALPFLSQALQRGLIASLLKCGSLLPFVEQPPAHRQPVMLLGDVLPGYTVYRSILYPVALAIDLAIGQRLDTRLPKGGELYKAWIRLKNTVDERCRLLRRDVTNERIQTCQNDNVSSVPSCSGAMIRRFDTSRLHAVCENEPHEQFQAMCRLSPCLLLQSEMSAVRLEKRKAQAVLYAGSSAVRSDAYVEFHSPLSAVGTHG